MRIDDYSVAWYAGMIVVQKHGLVCIYVDFKSLYMWMFLGRCIPCAKSRGVSHVDCILCPCAYAVNCIAITLAIAIAYISHWKQAMCHSGWPVAR